ncbi:MAG TPA: hypothetical protein VFG86_26785 [Chloroflexota bacterium]|jgi:hypothetical protein|nr:hypothetical protein [Chloroflexota bacterium]
MAGLERNRFRTRETLLLAAHATLGAHPEIVTLEQLAATAFGWSVRTLNRRMHELGIDKNDLADWPARRAQARARPAAPQPTRWIIASVVIASTLEEAIARFRAEISPTVEIVSVQRD